MTIKDHRFDYRDLLSDYPGEDKVRDRIALLTASAMDFIRERELGSIVAYNPVLMIEIVIDYFSDIKRLKDFHGIETTNLQKVAAYTGYWIARRKPLYLETVPSNDMLRRKPYLRNVNEWFAFAVMRGTLFDTRVPLQGKLGDRTQWNVFIDHLNYFLTYRVVTPQAIELALVALTSDPQFAEMKPSHR